MSIRAMLTQSVRVLRFTEGTPDEFGNQRPEYVPDSKTLPGRLRRLSAEEIHRAGETTTSDWRLYLSPEANLTGRDRVEVEGKTYELDANPYPVRGRRDVHHLEARVGRVG